MCVGARQFTRMRMDLCSMNLWRMKYNFMQYDSCSWYGNREIALKI